MGQCRFVINNLALSAVFSPAQGYNAPVNLSGWAPMADPSPSNGVRLTAQAYVTTGLFRYVFKIDLGGNVDVDTLALINTSIPTGGRVTAWLYYDDPDLGSTFIVGYATGALSDRTKSRNQVVISAASKVAARYISVYIDSPDPYIDIGSVVLGSSWQPNYNFDMDYQLGRIDMGTSEYNQVTGKRFAFKGARPRIWMLTLGTLDLTEVETYIDDIDLLVGATGDILFIPEHTDSYDRMSLRSVYGACRLSGEGLSGQFFPNLYRRPMRIQES